MVAVREARQDVAEPRRTAGDFLFGKGVDIRLIICDDVILIIIIKRRLID